MRRLDYDTELARSARPSPPARTRAEGRGRRKPRDPDERRALLKLSQAKWEQYVASGQLEIIAPRRWRLHLGEDRVQSYLQQQYKRDNSGDSGNQT